MKTSRLPCRACGRPIERGTRAGEERVYCSARCRHRRVGPRERSLERALLALLDRRAPGGSISPSELAREVGGDGWRAWMEPVRRAGRRLAHRGLVHFLQRGRQVDPATVRGPVRIRAAAPTERGPR